MKNKKLIILLLPIIVTTLYINFSVNAKESKAITGSNKWVGMFTAPAKGTLTSTGADNFTADMSSIGDGENQADVVLKGINLKKDTTYIYKADILSEKTNRSNIFFGIYTGSDYAANNGKKIYGEFNVALEKDKIYELTSIFTPTKDYSDLSLVYKFGRNGYETESYNNLANKITVTGSELIDIDDFDYSELNYTDLGPSINNNYKNYSYHQLSNIVVTKTDQKVISSTNVDTIAIQVSTDQIAKDNNDKYKIYLNNKQIEPVVVDIGTWYHIDYNKLTYEYNVLKTISEKNEKAYVVIKNINITNYRDNLLSQVKSKESEDNSSGMNNVIKKAIENLNDATTTKEMDDVITKFNSDFALEIVKSDAITEINKLLSSSSSKEVKDIINESEDMINSATTEENIDNIVASTKKKVKLQEYKEEVIPTIEEYAEEDSTNEVKDIIKTAKENIKDAKTEKEIDDIKDKFIKDIELQLSKEEAIEELQKELGKEYSNKVKEIYQKAKEKIESSTTEEEIEEILTQAKKDIKNQIEKENKKETITNPLTLDNIYIYILVLTIAVFTSLCLIKYRKSVIS